MSDTSRPHPVVPGLAKKDTAGGVTAANTVVERKVKPGGQASEYPLLLLLRRPALLVGRFPLPGGVPAGRLPIALPPGSASDGYFWARRPYAIYRFRDPAGRVAGHRFDAVAAVRVGPRGVAYRDLALDWWVLPGGEVIEEDEDEFRALVAAGILGQRDAELAGRARRAVTGHWRRIIAEVEEIERALPGRGAVAPRAAGKG